MLSIIKDNLKSLVTPDQVVRRSMHNPLQIEIKERTEKLKSVLKNKASNTGKEQKKGGEKAQGSEKIVLIDVGNGRKDTKQSPKRLTFIKELHITNFRLFAEILFEVEGSAKLIQDVVIILI